MYMYFNGLFNDTDNNSVHTASNSVMISKWRNGNGLKGKGLGLIMCIIPVFF
jgi:hypothetical protein